MREALGILFVFQFEIIWGMFLILIDDLLMSEDKHFFFLNFSMNKIQILPSEFNG